MSNIQKKTLKCCFLKNSSFNGEHDGTLLHYTHTHEAQKHKQKYCPKTESTHPKFNCPNTNFLVRRGRPPLVNWGSYLGKQSLCVCFNMYVNVDAADRCSYFSVLGTANTTENKVAKLACWGAADCWEIQQQKIFTQQM